MMKILISIFLVGLGGASAVAHTSLAPHEHPHAISMLPDMLALVIAALLVGAGVVAYRRFRKE
jgi:hypothetical protein